MCHCWALYHSYCPPTILTRNMSSLGLQLIVSPLRRLISKNNATIRDVGPPETVLASVGAFITGVP